MSVYEELSETQQFACRVIADHARSTAFAIADGILPGNEGRNYVLRKIMRRAIYHGREHLGLKDAFFYKVCDLVVENFSTAFPELAVQRDFIGKMVRLEEERFGNTLTVGLKLLDERLSIYGANEILIDTHGTKYYPEPAISFNEVAVLYDTHGTPVDLIFVKLTERPYTLTTSSGESVTSVELDEDAFRKFFDESLQQLQKRSGIGQTQRKSEISPLYAEVLGKVGANKFHGYDTTSREGSKVVGILDGDRQIDILSEGELGSVILDQTPFYAESGGQVGDTGVLVGAVPPADAGGSALHATVADTYSPVAGLIIHKVKVDQGSIKPGDAVAAIVDVEKRDATRRNHTATHLVHAALKEVLGTHVKQAGSVVAPNYLRFDFTHYQPMSDAEITEVEDLVNRYILQNEPVTTDMMAIEDAMRSGAVAMFGEKYGSEVRVLSVGDGKFSRELCGGTHVRATGDIGSFKITADEAIASGVRRIRAITGFDAFSRFREDEVLIDRSLDVLKTQRDQLPNAIEKLQDELKRTRKEIDDLKLKIATGQIGGASSNGDEAREVAGVKVLGKIVDGLDSNGMRQLSDTLLARLKSGVVVLGRSEEGKAGIIVRVSDDLKEKVKAGNVIKEIVPIVGGKGGGRPDMAEGGGPETAKLNEAIEASYKVIETFLIT
ncbi:MAG: alanine--tRNA ligase [Acidobacteria bacterium]|nr:alanine--tRNA ligase [Acidobacteriota bacterium]